MGFIVPDGLHERSLSRDNGATPVPALARASWTNEPKICSLLAPKSAEPAGSVTGWKPMLLYAVASTARAHGDSFQDGSDRALNSLEAQCSIGFQPVFCRTERCFPAIRRSL